MTSSTGPVALRVSAFVRHSVPSLNVRNDALVWVRSGFKILSNGETLITIPRDTIVLLPRDSQWSLVNDPGGQRSYEADFLEFSDSALTAFFQLHGSDFPTSGIKPGTSIEVDDLLATPLSSCFETQRSATSSLRLKIHKVVEILILLAERGYSFSPRDKLTLPDQVRRIVGQAPHMDWKSSRVAKHFHISESTLRRRLQEFGVTTHEVVNEVRLATALTLLQTTNLQIGEISHRCGYESHSRFTATFRQHYGYPPSYLRNSHSTEGDAKNEQHLTEFAQQTLIKAMKIESTLSKGNQGELQYRAA